MFNKFDEGKKAWYEEDDYTNEEYLKNISKFVLHKKGRGFYSIEDLIKILNTKYSSIILSSGLYERLSLIPLGNRGGFIDRNNEFYIHMKDALQNEFENTLFINWTGHCGPIAAALSEKDIPLIWNLDLSSNCDIDEDRIINQIQDYSNIIQKSKNDSTNLGLMLEIPHMKFIQTINYEMLPDANFWLKSGIKKVVLIVERPANLKISFSDIMEQLERQPKFIQYILSLVNHGLNIELLPTDVKTTGKEIPPEKERINPTDYAHNFSSQRNNKF